jgi:hypothetical protein
MTRLLSKIVSGGQSGADRAALDVAIELDIDHGGWVPRGRWAEDGPLAPRYQMQEAGSTQPSQRTEWNVRDTDATLIFSHGTPTGGTALTASFAQQHQKPALSIDLTASDEAQAASTIVAWLRRVRPKVLNVAGPRASNDPLIYDAVSRVLRRVLASE